ncbi:MAG: hypothetical protein KAJ33_05110 [Thermoplasmata archaeon]|nr:hypothetical protein [Thermoplasmata archaeon]
MKYKYCPSCKKAYIRSRLEKDTCIYCHEQCQTVDVKRNKLFYFGYGIMILGATSVFIPRFMTVSETMIFTVMGVSLAFAGAAFIMMGSVKMAKSAAEMAADSEEPDSKDDD